ncbi:hypothetical protein, partial [Escherichia coli]|uniref:hypothetical protein n=1 Tax=Escherichia coli TaxID=562 RepID=UPI003CFEE89B
DRQLEQPLPPIANFQTVPLESAADVKEKPAPEIRYQLVVRGLDAIDLDSEFKSFSSLKNGGGKAANATQISARAHEDEALAVRL